MAKPYTDKAAKSTRRGGEQSGLLLRLVTPKPPIKLIALLVVSAVGLALLAVGVTGHTGWTLIVIGFVALLVTLPSIWMIQRSRDRTLR
jgi:predicted tellurium resistance membrane protein TerC